MRQITAQITSKFRNRVSGRVGNSSTNGDALFLHGNKIAEFRGTTLWITNAGWATPTTKERLNGLPGVQVYQEKFEWFLNGKPWGGAWKAVEANGVQGL